MTIQVHIAVNGPSPVVIHDTTRDGIGPLAVRTMNPGDPCRPVYVHQARSLYVEAVGLGDNTVSEIVVKHDTPGYPKSIRVGKMHRLTSTEDGSEPVTLAAGQEATFSIKNGETGILICEV